MLRALESRAEELEYGRLVLDTTTVQRPAVALYTAHGYVRTGVGSAGPFTVLFFEKVLAPFGARWALSLSGPLW
jgi:hypothetical protein